MSRRIRALQFALAVSLLPLIVGALAPNPVWRQWGDAAAEDGKLELLTEPLISALRIGSGILGFFFAVLIALLSRFPKRASEYLSRRKTALAAWPRAFFSDALVCAERGRSFLRIDDRTVRIGFVLIWIIGISLRGALLNRPMTHDESYTVVTWASGSFRYAVSDYHLPNNHIFHTLLVWFIYHFVGKSPALLRLPAFLAGGLLIPAVFYLGKKFYGERTGLIAEGLAALSPFLIDYATNARGYSAFALSAVLLFILADALRRRPNRLIEATIPIVAALSFFTLPITLYPFGAMCVWLTANALTRAAGDASESGPELLAAVFRIGLATIALTVLLYLPLFHEAGTAPLFDNVFVRPLPASDFRPTMISRGLDFLDAFSDGIGPVLSGILLVGAALTLVPGRRTRVFPTAAAFLLWLAPLILWRRPNLWPRTQLYLFPFLFVWGAGGIASVGGTIAVRLRNGGKLPSGAALARAVRVLWLAVWIVLLVPALQRTARIAAIGSPHEAAIQTVLQRETREGIGTERKTDEVYFIVAPEDDAAIWYYADLHAIGKRFFDRNRPFRTVYVYVNPVNEGYEEPRTVEDVVERYGPGAAFLDWETKETVFERLPEAKLFRFDANKRVIRETFGE